MAAVTEIGKTYKIIGSNINAHNDYTLPKNLNSQYRGKSKKVAFALKANDDKITIVEMVRRVEEGAPDNKESARFPENAKKVAFEVVKASVEGKEGEYYIWVVYNGVVKVEAFIEEGEQDPEPIDNNSTPDPGPDDDKNKTTPITNEKEQQTSGTEIHVKAGQTVVLKVETGGSVPTPKPCDKKVRIQLVDEQGKKMDSNCYVSFFDQNLVETKVKITKGEGCEDLKEGTYTAIIDNSLEAFSAFKGKLSSEVSLKNLQLIQPGFLYRVRELNSIKTTIYNNTLRYQQNWKAGDSDETSYYKGIYKETHPNLPVRANRSMELGKLLPGEYIRIDQVLFHAKEVKNKGRELPFMAAKISSKVSQKKEWFAWLIYDEGGKEMEKVELASTTVKISGSASLKLKVSPTDILYEKNKGLVVIGNEIANYPKVVEVDWHFPEVESHTKDIREVYYKDPNDNDKNKKKKKKFLGLTYKPGITANFTVKLDKPIIDSHEMPLTVIFQKFELAEGLPEKQVTYTFTLKSTDQETQDNTTYKLKIEKGILFRVFEELKLKLHYSTVSVSAKAGSKVIDSKHQAYPVIQHELFFLPGVFGSELSVNYKDGVEEAWPEFSKQGDKEFELLACDDKGNAHREVDDSELEIFRKVLCIIDIHVENKIISNLLKKDENEFPSIFLDEEKNKELKPVIYQDVPYDWRLIMNNTCNDNPFPFLKRIIDQIKRKREENIRKHVFLDEKINLSGHSTGGVIIQGILSTKNELKDLIKGAFYISTPFYGAPKAEYLYLTGIESGLNFYVIPNSIRQIATNIPITYFLYAKEKLGAYWKLEERKKRILAAEQNGDYSVFPSDLYGWPKGLQRDRLQFNDLLAEKAEKYDEYIKENYPDIPSYLFYSFAEKEDTIYATETS
ncbi:MAG: hypothetical protein GDA37_07650, partial [Ekhidna sp.]|nr:hypothetical protein [Ekhidna sp.]